MKGAASNASYLIPHWPAPERVRAVVTTRFGGMSNGAFASFNQAQHCGDDPVRVAQNRHKLMRDHRLEQICWLHQVHGTHVVRASAAALRQSVTADALWTDDLHLACAVLTADCLPVFLYAPEAGAVGVAHCGWRGLSGGILERLIAQMPGPPHLMLAWLGPAISREFYEVGDDVHHIFANRYGLAAVSAAFRAAEQEHKWTADLARMARFILNGLDVAAFTADNFCTWEDPRFYSSRREKVTGRMASVIWMA